MRNVRSPLLWVAMLLMAAVTAAQPTASAVGTWLAEDGASCVQIAPCADKLCGTVTWLRNPNGPDGKPLTDRRNPNPAKRGRPILGLRILKGLVADRSGPDQWEGGTIYDPATGKTYHCTIELQNPQTLRVHGYVGVAMFGQTRTWTRAD